MHDGQNLFQSSTSFGGVEWKVDETLDGLIAAGSAQEVIVVGINNTSNRIAEYTPTIDPGYGGGNANAYLDFIESAILPFVNTTYRTLSGPSNTFMMGSSLGGLVSFFAGWSRSSVYGTIGAISASFWWNDEELTVEVEQFTDPKIPVRVYLDVGGKEGAESQVVKMRNALLALGYQYGSDLAYYFDPPGQHNEASWAQRLPTILPFIVGKD
jgi:predicted alpha/beta superfamily hydrolase